MHLRIITKDQGSVLFKCFQECVPRNPGLRADCPQGRSLDRFVIRDCHGSFRPIGIGAFERDMIPGPDNLETKNMQRVENPLFWDVVREFHFR